MNCQEIFNKVTLHLLTQMKKSFIKEGTELPNGETAGPRVCAYRGENDTKCAAGILIPDDHYKPEMEACLVGKVLSKFPGCIPGINFKDDSPENMQRMQLVRDLQSVHDSAPVWDWGHELRQTAKNHALEFNPDTMGLSD